MNLTKETVKRLHAEGPEWFRPELEEFYGEAFFKPTDFRSIKTFADVCLENGTNEQELNARFEDLDLDTINYEKVKLIVKAINQGWYPDWKDRKQYKYFPWFEIDKAGAFCLSVGNSAFLVSVAVGSRLCFESSEKCRYAAEQFWDIYKQFLL